MRIPNPYQYDLRRVGGYDGSRLEPNCSIEVANVQLEKLTPERPDDPNNVHLLIGSAEPAEYTDEVSLYPKLRISDCDGVSAWLGSSIASASFERCSINTLAAPGLRGALAFTECEFQPNVLAAEGDLYALDSTLGTRLTNCTVHAPVVAADWRPELVDQSGLLQINGPVRHYQLNTALGNDVLDYLRGAGIALDPAFIANLRAHHALEE